MRRPRISLTMIARNEAEHLGKCLGSVADLVDEVIVCDTGSTDATVEIARGFGARIVEFPWCDDFAAARNASVAPATGDIIFTIDADEFLADEARAIFRQEVEALRPGWCMWVPILSYFDPDRLVPEMTHHSTMVRIFWNEPHFRWTRPVHVQLVDTRTGEVPPSQGCRLTTFHFGYLPRAWEKQNKRARVAILERLAREEGHRAHNHYFLGKMHFVEGHFDEAAACMRRALEVAGPLAADGWLPSAHNILLSSLLNLARSEEMRTQAKESRRRHPGDAEIQFHEAIADFLAGDAIAAERSFRALLAVGGGMDDASILAWKLDYWLGRVALARGDAPAAAEHLGKASGFAPRNAEVLGNLAEALALAGRPSEARERLRTLNEVSPGERQSEFVEALCLLAEGRNADAASRFRPLAESGFRRRDSLLYLGCAQQVLGELAEAEAAFRAILHEWPGDDGVRLALIQVLIASGKGPQAAAVWREMSPTRPPRAMAEGLLRQAGIKPDAA